MQQSAITNFKILRELDRGETCKFKNAMRVYEGECTTGVSDLNSCFAYIIKSIYTLKF